MKKSKAFTLIEAMVALTIFISLVLIGTLNLNRYRQDLVFNNTIIEFKMAMQQAIRIATIQKKPITIYSYPNQHYILFSGPKYSRKMRLDSSISISELKNYHIAASGAVSPKTIIFLDKYQKQAVKIQMTWGKTFDEK